MFLKVMLHDTIRNGDFERNITLDCLRADVSNFLCCTRATKETGDVCTQAKRWNARTML